MTGEEFEAEVLAIARAMWPEAASSGPVIRGGRERDGEFRTKEATYLIECTVERTKAKAEHDIEKLQKRLRYLRKGDPTGLYKAYFITEREPTADQRGIAEKAQEPLEALSFREFRKRLVDADRYLTARSDYAFGSMRDPRTADYRLSHSYVGLEFQSHDGESDRFEDLLAEVRGSGRLVLLGDYGAGKSTTLSELFRQLKKDFVRQKHSRFPVVLNLRDHHAQTDPAEALERHARTIGYGSAADLVRAWRAGYLDLLLDGFDEIAVVGWAGAGRELKNLRFRSMELIRRFVNETPSRSAVVIAGRAHYFDNHGEARRALGAGPGFKYRTVSELRGDAIRDFLDAIGWNREVPYWVPTRPLLLGYLAAHGILSDVVDEGDLSPASGWDTLLTKISEREALLEGGVDPDAIRRLIEEVAILARSANDGLGQIAPREIVDAFVRVCGYEPDDRGAVLLQRLPGLGAHQTEDGARVFVDRDFANAAAGSATAYYVSSPYTVGWDSSEWQYALSPLGLEVAALRLSTLSLGEGQVTAAIEAAIRKGGRDVLTADLVSLMGSEDYAIPRDILIQHVWILEMPFYLFDGDLGRVTLRNCVVGELEIPSGPNRKHLPRFESCEIATINGCSREAALPDHRFIDCSIAEFEPEAKTTDALMELGIPVPVRVGLTILKKLFRQSGAGRREGSLYRGLDQEAQRFVPSVLDVLRRYDFVVPTKQGSNTVWLPTKLGGAGQRAQRLLDDPQGSKDPVLTPLRKL